MYQFVEDLKEEQYKAFIEVKKLDRKSHGNKDCFYFGVAKDRKLVACCKVFIEIENRKKVFFIPLGIQTIIEDIELYQFFKKYLSITAKKYNVRKIKIYSSENSNLLQIGFIKTRKNTRAYLPLKKEKEIIAPNYLQVLELNSERKRKKLKELKTKNKDLFLFNNVSFFALQLDLYTYLDTVKEERKKEVVTRLLNELGDILILESISIEYLNDKEAFLIDNDNYSSVLLEERKNIFFPKLKEELVKKGIKKLYLPSTTKSSLPLEQDIIIEYEMNI